MGLMPPELLEKALALRCNFETLLLPAQECKHRRQLPTRLLKVARELELPHVPRAILQSLLLQDEPLHRIPHNGLNNSPKLHCGRCRNIPPPKAFCLIHPS